METIPDSTRVYSQRTIIRRLWLFERLQWREHLLRLSPAARQTRFAGAVGDSYIRDYCDSAEIPNSRLVGCFINGVLRGVGEFRLMNRRWPQQAELAFSVEDGFQGQGLGKELFRRVMNMARNRGVQRLFIVSESGNDRMRRVARKFNMHINTQYGDMEGWLELHWPDYSSVMEEALEEGAALVRSLHVTMTRVVH